MESTTLEEAKKTMHLTLKNKNQFVEDPSKPGKDRSIQREVKYRWPNNEVPYKIETVFTEDEKAKIASVSNISYDDDIKRSPTGNPKHPGQLMRDVPPSNLHRP